MSNPCRSVENGYWPVCQCRNDSVFTKFTIIQTIILHGDQRCWTKRATCMPTPRHGIRSRDVALIAPTAAQVFSYRRNAKCTSARSAINMSRIATRIDWTKSQVPQLSSSAEMRIFRSARPNSHARSSMRSSSTSQERRRRSISNRKAHHILNNSFPCFPRT